MHPRATIRKAVVEILKGKTHAKDRIYSNRSIPAIEENLPAIHVYTPSEEIEEWTQAPRALKRTLSLVIEVIARATKDCTLEDCLDEMAEQVEQTLSLDDSLNHTADDCLLTQVSMDSMDDGALPIGSCRMTFGVKYITDMPKSIEDQAVQLRPLERIGAQWNIDRANDDDDPDGVLEEATDLVTLNQS